MSFDSLVENYFEEFSSKKIVFNRNEFFSNSELEDLVQKIKDDEYYLIENKRVIWKKKKYTFIGDIRLISRGKAVSFLREKVKPDWYESFYLKPLSNIHDAIFIDEEGCFTLIRPMLKQSRE
ncbi:MAG: hypothetical protein AB8B56_18660 [Crocinitomicaceae bacterium]